MAPLPRSAFAALLRELEGDGFRRFVADLYAARGWSVRLEGDRVVASNPPEERRLLVCPRSRWLGGGSEPAPDGWTRVTNARRPTADGTIDADDLYEMALYALDREARDDLFCEHFDRPATVDPDDPDAGGRRAPRPLLVAAVGVALLAVAGAALIGAAGPFDPPGAATPAAPGSRVTPVPSPATPAGTPADGTPTTTVDGTVYAPVGIFGVYPPGLADSGVLDAEALAAAHARAVGGRSYRLVIAYREYVDGELSAAVIERIAVESPTVYVTSIERRGTPRRDPAVIAEMAAYADGQARYELHRDADGRRFVRTRPRPPSADRGRFADRVATYLTWYLSVAESEITGSYDRRGRTFHRVVAVGDPWPGSANETTRAVVDSYGVVHRLHREHDVPNANVSVVVSIRYTAIGNVTVDPPAWYDEARAATANATGAS